MLNVGSDFSGVGAFNQSLIRLGIDYKESFACDMDKYARKTFIDNYGTDADKEVVNSKEHDSICDSMNKWIEGKIELPENLFNEAEQLAKSFSFYYPLNVNHRTIPENPLDIYMTSPPCQGFSMAGKREGSVLFYNSHEFIQKNRPKYFIFENVKGLLSHEGGKTFNTWVDYLGGKSINGNPVIFPREESVPYHIFYKVVNAKKCGVPQNRERVFIVGIRDNKDSISFNWDKDTHLTKHLKDVLEDNVDDKYFLSDKMVAGLTETSHLDSNRINNTLRCGGGSSLSKKHSFDVVKVKSATKKGYELATKDDSINFSVPNSETRRGRVGKGVAQTLDTGCNQGVLIGAIRGRNPENPTSRQVGLPTVQQLEINENGTSNALTTVQKDNVVVSGFKIRRLTPRECFRLMDFPEIFKMPCSDSQMYKQAGNSIVVACLEGIIKKFNL